ncbi:hypothetical protein, partial [Salinivibrio sp. VYel6]|uniref:phage nozzle protein n=1 Tax=Salinivibrio sp. VYel6 TaxID=2490493 RepID=UPI00156253E8
MKFAFDYNDSRVQQRIAQVFKSHGFDAWQEDKNTVFEVPVGTKVSVSDYSTIDVKYAFYFGSNTSDQDPYDDPSSSGYITRTFSSSVVHAHPHGKSVVKPEPETPVAYVWIKQTDYAVTYTVSINGHMSQIETPEATSKRARAGLNTEKLTRDLASKINEGREKHGCIAEVWESAIKIYHTTGADFDIKTTDGLYNS